MEEREETDSWRVLAMPTICIPRVAIQVNLSQEPPQHKLPLRCLLMFMEEKPTRQRQSPSVCSPGSHSLKWPLLSLWRNIKRSHSTANQPALDILVCVSGKQKLGVCV